MERLNNLKRIPRTGWLLCNVSSSEVEDVAQHTFDVTAITLLLADELERQGKKIDQGRALSMAVVHDWAEASVGDFPYTALKYLGPAGTKKRVEKRALEDLFGKLPKREKYLALWQEYSEKRTPEANLVHAADYLSMLVQAVKYRERGNRSRELDELWRAVKKDLARYMKEFKPVRELVGELDKRYSA
ncbi:MAG: HD domain-containing protein [Candidatus Hodarchaeaceae archaeon]|nr:HD domain-containing protein [Candidatus Hodarchaeaceae archaeon]MDI6883905.1 HD domain-containing protein [Hadesarchaea archaeon]